MVALVLVLSVGLLLLLLVVLVGLLDCCWGLSELVVPLVEGPRGELAMFESCFDVVQFLVHGCLC